MFLSPLQSLLNRTLADSVTATNLCRKLEGRVLALNVTSLNLTIFCGSDGQKLTLSTAHPDKPDASITGSPLALLGLVTNRPEAQIRSGVVQIEGDAEAAQGFQNLLKAVRPDLEEELSRLVGDVAAYQIGSLARSALSFGQKATRTFGQNLTEYLQEEGRDLPTRLEVNEFTAGVDRIRDDVERVAARLALIERRRKANSGRRTVDSQK